jgi:hypothetical protein
VFFEGYLEMNAAAKLLAALGIPFACWIGWNLYEENREVPSDISVTDLMTACVLQTRDAGRGMYFHREANPAKSLFVVKDELFEHTSPNRDGHKERLDFIVFSQRGEKFSVKFEGEWVSTARTLLPGLRFKIDERTKSGRAFAQAFDKAESVWVGAGKNFATAQTLTPHEVGQFSACVERTRD